MKSDRLRVLLIEDNPIDTQVIREYLARRSRSSWSMSSGSTALARLPDGISIVCCWTESAGQLGFGDSGPNPRAQPGCADAGLDGAEPQEFGLQA